jgi:hypothetical protein
MLGQKSITGIANLPSLLNWQQISEVDLHQERRAKYSSSANTDAQPDSDKFICSLHVSAFIYW